MPNYNSVTPEIIAQLEQVVPGRVVVGADVNPDYSRDEMPIYGTRMPEVSIDVLTTEEVAGIVKICYENNIPVTTRGAGTGLAGGCTPICGGVVICTMRMNKILSYDLENFAVTVQPASCSSSWPTMRCSTAACIRRIRARRWRPWAATSRPTQAACALSSTAAPATMSAQ